MLVVIVESMAITYVVGVSFARVVGKILAVPGGLNSRLSFYSFMVRYVVSSLGPVPQGWRVMS